MNIISKIKDDILRESFRKHPNQEKIKHLNEKLEFQLYKNKIR